MRSGIGAALVLVGCSVAFFGCAPDSSYQGTATWSMNFNGQVQNTDQVEIHELLAGSNSDYVIVSANCDLPADNVGNKQLLILPTTCINYKDDGSRIEMVLSGEGAWSEGENLSLSLQGPITYVFRGERL
jgi:hypothetical protein